MSDSKREEVFSRSRLVEWLRNNGGEECRQAAEEIEHLASSDAKHFADAMRNGARLEIAKEREKMCATMGEQQKVALVRAFQECCDALGIDSMRESLADLVREVGRRCAVRTAVLEAVERQPKAAAATGKLYQLPNGQWVTPSMVSAVAALGERDRYCDDGGGEFSPRVGVFFTPTGSPHIIPCNTDEDAEAMRDKIADDINLLVGCAYNG